MTHVAPNSYSNMTTSFGVLHTCSTSQFLTTRVTYTCAFCSSWIRRSTSWTHLSKIGSYMRQYCTIVYLQAVLLANVRNLQECIRRLERNTQELVFVMSLLDVLWSSRTKILYSILRAELCVVRVAYSFQLLLELGLNCTARAKLLAELHFCPETSKRTTEPSNLDLFQIASFPSVLGKFANSDGDMAERRSLRASEKTLCKLVYIFGAAMSPSLLVNFNVDWQKVLFGNIYQSFATEVKLLLEVCAPTVQFTLGSGWRWLS